LQELIRIFEASGLAEIEVEDEKQRVRLTKPSAQVTHFVQAPAAQPVVQAAVAQAPQQGSSAAAETEAAPGETIDSPMVGTFYACPSPGEPPFVTVGSRVEAGQTICIVEAMKIMNEVTAKTTCIIESVLAEDGEPVEYGQPLFSIRSAN